MYKHYLSHYQQRRRVNRHVCLLLQHILVGRADYSASVEVEFLYSVRHPSYDTGHREDRCVDLLGQSDHLINEATVEVQGSAGRLGALPMLHQTLDSFLLQQAKEVVFFLASLLLGKLSGKAFQLYCPRIALCVDCMTDAIDKSRLVVSLLVQHPAQVGINLVDARPVADVLLQVVEHICYLNVCAAVEGSLERAYACRNARIGVSTRRRSHPDSERAKHECHDQSRLRIPHPVASSEQCRRIYARGRKDMAGLQEAWRTCTPVPCVGHRTRHTRRETRRDIQAFP